LLLAVDEVGKLIEFIECLSGFEAGTTRTGV
jgi:hypothetical protein